MKNDIESTLQLGMWFEAGAQLDEIDPFNRANPVVVPLRIDFGPRGTNPICWTLVGHSVKIPQLSHANFSSNSRTSQQK
jgi:hypothetical protein